MNPVAEVIFAIIILKIQVLNPTENFQRFGQTGVKVKKFKVPLYRVKML